MDEMPEATYTLVLDMYVCCLAYPFTRLCLEGFLRNRYGIEAEPKYGKSSSGLTLIAGVTFDPFIDIEASC